MPQYAAVPCAETIVPRSPSNPSEAGAAEESTTTDELFNRRGT